VEDREVKDRFAAALPSDLKATARRILGDSGGIMVVAFLRPAPISSILEHGESESQSQVAAVTIPTKDRDGFNLWLRTQMLEDLRAVSHQLADQMKKKNRE